MISHAVRIFFEKKHSAGVPYHFWLILAHFGSLSLILNALNTLKNGKNGSFFEIHHFFWKQNRFLKKSKFWYFFFFGIFVFCLALPGTASRHVCPALLSPTFQHA